VIGGPDTLLNEGEYVAIDILIECVETLGPEIHTVHVANDGTLRFSSEDPTLAIRYPLCLDDPNDTNQVLKRSQLEEVDRIVGGVDYVMPTIGLKELVVFKYTMREGWVKNVWDEMHILRGLRGHPSFVSFHRAIIDDVEPRVVGFTSVFVAGGDLNDNTTPTLPFHFCWLEELTSAVDDLNLKFGIVHQDIAPRNVLVDATTKRLKIFDFDRSARIGVDGALNDGRDVDGVICTIYESLTKNREFEWHSPEDANAVEALELWDLKAKVEDEVGGIDTYRNFLRQWSTRRRAQRIRHFSEATNPLEWPTIPSQPFISGADADMDLGPELRRTKRARGEYVISWERDPQVGVDW
jgi:hypothetical protein